MYPTVDRIISLMNEDPTRPVIICEYAHAMGNSLGNFRKHWDAFDRYPRLQGWFIWDWVDQALRHPGPDGRVVWNWVNTSDGANANDGLVNADRIPQPESQEARKILQPVKIEPVDLARGRVRLCNDYDFLDLGALALEWRLLEDGLAVQSGVVAGPFRFLFGADIWTPIRHGEGAGGRARRSRAGAAQRARRPVRAPTTRP
jgi:beta-galactosidase